ncbi:MAG: Phosphoribosylanthranilate isomerase [Clostridia bacterium]|jgi:phosphoribosylanthranilate isomerase|nr:Phosphoribosylanthranilate isomerase [Clostridia bacterium]
MIKIKICGLTREEDIHIANECFPDYIGFVFAKSKRQLSLSQAKHLKHLLSPSVKAVGVFVNEPISSLIRYENEQVIDIIQLHGDESDDYVKELKKKIKLPIIKAIRVKNEVNPNQNHNADFLLFDKYLEGAYGGGGESFDWQVIKNIKEPYFLAGGINLNNVREAIKKTPYGIDVSSGVETNGVKDRDKILEMISIVREQNSKMD